MYIIPGMGRREASRLQGSKFKFDDTFARDCSRNRFDFLDARDDVMR